MRKHNKGAVTVFVTLLLIPAILVSGTGVDLSRIYAARSTTRDANQLAANALLTNYDALLQDLYGLYAVIGDDDDLVEMMDVYVKASLFGENVTDAQLGEFRLFGGQESVSTAVSASAPMSNVEILRHQIEEYSKYRVPVAIVSEILDRLNNGELQEMGANTEACAKKLEVDEQFENTLTKFNEVIEKAEQLVGNYMTDEETAYKKVNEVTSQIRYQLGQMLAVRREYEAETDIDQQDDIQDHYNAIAENINSCAFGGWIGYNWVAAHVDDEGNDIQGQWDNPHYEYYDGLQTVINQNVEKLESHCTKLDELVQLCQEADAAKSALAQKISELEEKLNSGTCSPELVENMRKELADAKKLLSYNFTELGTQMKLKANDYIVGTSTPPLKNIQGYGTPGGVFLSFSNLQNVALLSGFQIRLHVDTALYYNVDDRLEKIQTALAFYVAPQRYPTFESVSEAHKECYDLIKNGEFHIKSDAELDDDDKKEKSKVTELFNLIKDLWNGLTDYDPAPGAKSYSASSEAKNWAFSSDAGLKMDFLLGTFSFGSSNESGISSTLKNFANFASADADIAKKFSTVLSNASERILLVGYATQMFSNWSYKDAEGDAPLSLTGQPIDASSHYFYNSEWEYLLNGDLDAGSNLGKITWTILGLRFLANYASSYMISGINSEIKAMEAAVSAIPFAGGVLRFLVRPLYVLGESVVDVSLLRTGHKIPLLKRKVEEWKFALAGALVSELKQAIEDQAEKVAGTDAQSVESGLLYTDYLTIFLLITEPGVLAARIRDLIALNVTTSKSKLAEKAEGSADARAEAAKNVALFDLSKANTTFAVTTKTEVRFMFLSMPFAQQGINGIVPSTTFSVAVTDYRGY